MTLIVSLNGAAHECGAACRTVADLIDELALAGKRIAVERNGEIVPRSRYPEVALAAGDRLEVVAAVGGG